MLDQRSVIPLYVQLMEKVQEYILSGIYKPGTRLPSEAKLAEIYGVSVVTVRSAIGILCEKGLVERKQGKGTFVSKPKYTRDIKKLQSFSEMCQGMGLEPGGKMLENKLIFPDKKIAAQLEQDKDTQVIFLSRVRYADEEPVVIENNYFPLSYSFLLGNQFDNNSLFKFIKEENSIVVASSEKKIEICHATALEAALLNINKGDPLLLINSTAYTKDNQIIYSGRQLINGERFSLYVYETMDI